MKIYFFTTLISFLLSQELFAANRLPHPKFVVGLGGTIADFSKEASSLEKKVDSYCEKENCTKYQRIMHAKDISMQLDVYVRKGAVFSVSFNYFNSDPKKITQVLPPVSKLLQSNDEPLYIKQLDYVAEDGLTKGYRRYFASWPFDGGLAIMTAYCQTAKTGTAVQNYRNCVASSFKYFSCENNEKNCQVAPKDAKNDIPF